MKHLMGIEYGRGATAVIIEEGPALAPSAVKNMYPNFNWTIVSADSYDAELCKTDRFGENYQIQKKIFTEASGAPHGTNVRALLGDGDERWLSLQTKRPALHPENIFYLGTRSYEPSEINFVNNKGIYVRRANELQTLEDLSSYVDEIKRKIGTRKYVVSFDFDAIDPEIFKDVLVPEKDGISLEAAEYFIKAFSPNAHGIEFVEYSPTGDKKSSDIVKHLIDICLKN